ncbi:hypothetical protein DACRYDRAFT_88387 [Dacryopinax primogenitus]|uniref:tRNA (guanine(37)-N1)-methyltransferase n=1 Tax=Dacryopinax primogenitus (strain DJM 731) TaxID=1858805 RepID=M5G1L9_DACPD|nr:uncharacterized protein DACRYDRAFT_88387 [Dacryopinax primogenitus]EJU02614.1 hypothetical protein DACRYDRAFT_88387 [Dacryopinax primogenitus]
MLLSSDREDEIDPEGLAFIKDRAIELLPYDIKLTYDFWDSNDILSTILPPDVVVPNSFTSMGHIIHLNLRAHQLPFKHLIGEVFLSKSPGMRTVVNKTDKIHAQYRYFEMELLAGEPDFMVHVSESRHTFMFDYREVYFNTRLGTEHDRIVSKLSGNGLVCDVMGGVGPFAIPAAAKGCAVMLNDLNPAAIKWAKLNVEKNDVSDLIRLYEMDGVDFIRKSVIDAFKKPFPPFKPRIGRQERKRLEWLEEKKEKKRLAKPLRAPSLNRRNDGQGTSRGRKTDNVFQSPISRPQNDARPSSPTSSRTPKTPLLMNPTVSHRNPPSPPQDRSFSTLETPVTSYTDQAQRPDDESRESPSTSPADLDVVDAAPDEEPQTSDDVQSTQTTAPDITPPLSEAMSHLPTVSKLSAIPSLSDPAAVIPPSTKSVPRPKYSPSSNPQSLPDLPNGMERRTPTHYILNLPTTAIQFLFAFRGLLRPIMETHLMAQYYSPTKNMPMIHVYCFTNALDEDSMRADILKRASDQLKYPLTLDMPELELHYVRKVAPTKTGWCLSFRLPWAVAIENVSEAEIRVLQDELRKIHEDMEGLPDDDDAYEENPIFPDARKKDRKEFPKVDMI